MEYINGAVETQHKIKHILIGLCNIKIKYTFQMELECFTILDPSTLELFLTAKFKNIKPELRRPSLQNFYDIERLPLLTSANNQEVFLEYSQPTNRETKIRFFI